MTRFRLVIASFVAVAMMSVGAAACTPQQQIDAGNFVYLLIYLHLIGAPPLTISTGPPASAPASTVPTTLPPAPSASGT